MSKTNTEQSNSRMSVNEFTQQLYSAETKTPTQLNIQIETTPIWIRGNDEFGYAATVGNYRITEIKQTAGEVEEEIRLPSIETICHILDAYICAREEFEKITKKQTDPDLYSTKEQ